MATTQIPDALASRAVDIHSLVPYPGNARQGDLNVIIESLQAHGQYRPIVVQASTRHILAGNHTWEAAKHLGWETIAADLIDVTDEQARKIVLVDNASNDHADYDTEQLVKLLQETQEDYDLTGTGFTDEGLQQLIDALNEDDEDEEDEVPASKGEGGLVCLKCGYDCQSVSTGFRKNRGVPAAVL
ncbi:ParB/RepB/Spo0J family partition protein [Nesterenkonia flava]|uniref:ParB N-terminal domain-containing protein n=1 Tax=Nesterenkonia flava TaxID=469799 RepID=A0ABU1FW72_9MICC|nr:ParB N-terminal domain-containing protein [Nesterenkonia flava]MDR5712933.1 ParB N-terminal domain-containing protein [Nesterenkonia flava]